MTITSADGFPGVELRHLHALCAIAETRSFSRAAEQLGYAQSAVSQQIAALERAVGSRLVERPGGPRQVSLTEAGTVLVRHATSVLGRLTAARADLEALSAGRVGTVRVGTFQSAGARLLPRVMQRYREGWPDVRVELIERQEDAELYELVRAGTLDLTFGVGGFGIERYDGLDSVQLIQDRYVLLAPPGSPLIGRDEPVDLASLDGIDVIGFSAQGSSCAGLTDEAWRRAQSVPNVVFRTDDNLTLQRLVAAGLGHALVPSLTYEAGDGAPVTLEVGDAVDPRTIGLYWHAQRFRSAAADAFVRTAVEVCAPAPVA